MSLLHKNQDSYLIDHRDYISNIYKDTLDKQHQVTSYTILAQLFSVINIEKSRAGAGRKRMHNSDELHEETLAVRRLYEAFVQDIPSDIKSDLVAKYKLVDTSDVRNLSKQLFESTILDFAGINGGNNSLAPVKCGVKGINFLIPPSSRFFCGDVTEQCSKLKGSKFDILIADPPWWNKYIRRLKHANDKLSYSMMYNEDIAAIPVKELLSDNCLVAVWCTNSPSNIDAVKNLIFPQWGVEYVASWYWLKVTVDLQPLCEFGTGCKKQPYERLILGKVGEINDVPDGKMIVSIPSALHSHKPPLLELLSPFVKTEDPSILELFARYLLPNTTSVGYEPLKWQHESLYQEIT